MCLPILALVSKPVQTKKKEKGGMENFWREEERGRAMDLAGSFNSY